MVVCFGDLISWCSGRQQLLVFWLCRIVWWWVNVLWFMFWLIRCRLLFLFSMVVQVRFLVKFQLFGILSVVILWWLLQILVMCECSFMFFGMVLISCVSCLSLLMFMVVEIGLDSLLVSSFGQFMYIWLVVGVFLIVVSLVVILLVLSLLWYVFISVLLLLVGIMFVVFSLVVYSLWVVWCLWIIWYISGWVIVGLLVLLWF